MQTRKSTHISIDFGVEGDSRGDLSIRKSNMRQVTILSEESWNQALTELEAELGADLFDKSIPWPARRANLLIRGKTFGPEDVGKRISIGDVLLEITCETDPCSKMDNVQQGLKNALFPGWRGGVCAMVIAGGDVQVGNQVLVTKS